MIALSVILIVYSSSIKLDKQTDLITDLGISVLLFNFIEKDRTYLINFIEKLVTIEIYHISKIRSI